MRIDCPHCGFSREVPDDKLPATAAMATCPKCRHKFRFRDASEPQDFAISPQDDLTPPSPASLAGQPAHGEDDDATPLTELDDQPHAGEAPPAPGRPKAPDAPEDDIWSRLEELEHDDTAGSGDEGAGAPAPGEIAWEHLDKHGFFGGLLGTLKAPMTHPAEFFTAMPTTGGLGRPLAFYLLVAMVDTLAQLFWASVITSVPFLGGEPGQDADALGFGIGSTAIIALLPILVTVGIFVTSAVTHLCLKIFGAANAGYQGTFRVLAYGYAPNILGIIPLIGGMVGGLWSMYLYFVGLKHAHRTTYLKVFLASLLPLLIITAAAALFVTMMPPSS